jgi:hypothetical protein
MGVKAVKAIRRALAYALGEIGAGFLQLAFWVGGLRSVEDKNFAMPNLPYHGNERGTER